MNVSYLGTLYTLHTEADLAWFFAVIVQKTAA